MAVCLKWTLRGARSLAVTPKDVLPPSRYRDDLSTPGPGGDEVSCYAQIVKIGRTSMTVKIQAFAHRGRTGEKIAVTEGLFTCVAINSEGKPRPVVDPPIEN